MNYHKFKHLLVTIFWAMSIGAIARDTVIYGEDNRIETYQSKSALYKRLASSTAAQVPLEKIEFFGNNAALIGNSIAEEENICKEARFSHQPKIAKCSGVLVAPDIIITAGHCMMAPSECTDYAWVFNYKVRNSRQKNVVVRKRDVYRCKEVIQWELTTGKDYAIIRLDRKVQNAAPVKVATTKPRVGTELVTIGTPTGLPQKITDGGVVKSLTATEFKANLDTFNWGSGSPVFNKRTGEYLGILVRGETDFIQHKTKDCMMPNVISDESPGEDISSTTQFAHLLENL